MCYLKETDKYVYQVWPKLFYYVIFFYLKISHTFIIDGDDDDTFKYGYL